MHDSQDRDTECSPGHRAQRKKEFRLAHTAHDDKSDIRLHSTPQSHCHHSTTKRQPVTLPEDSTKIRHTALPLTSLCVVQSLQASSQRAYLRRSITSASARADQVVREACRKDGACACALPVHMLLCTCACACTTRARILRAHFLRGGVSGRLPNNDTFCLSAGLRMRKEHMRLSSTAMTAPALSNSPQ